jgi:hypothetical protein
VVEDATRALEAVRYGVAGLDDDDARRVFELLRTVRAAAGDFPADGADATPEGRPPPAR